mgnify:FL=1
MCSSDLASVAIAAILVEERTREARAFMRAALGGATVPSLWPIGGGNILLRAERRGDIRPDEREAHVADLSALALIVDHEGAARAWRETTALALRHRLTLYDATYLELAIRLRVPLATFDAALARAAEAQ